MSPVISLTAMIEMGQKSLCVTTHEDWMKSYTHLKAVEEQY
jgi:hypothetical protein